MKSTPLIQLILVIVVGLLFAGSVTYARINNPTVTGGAFTSGSVVFSDGSGLAQDNSNLFWDDTNNRLGIATTTPFAQLAIESDGTGNIFYVGDKGTSTSLFLIDGSGFVSIGVTNPKVKFSVGDDVLFETKLDIGVPGAAGGLDVGEGGSYTTDKDGTTIVQAFKYDESASPGSRFTEVEVGDTVTWNSAVDDRFYVCSTKKFWGMRLNVTTAKSSETLKAYYYDGTSTTSMDYMGIQKDSATSTGQTIFEQTNEKEYVTWDHNIINLWKAADDVADTIPDLDVSSFCVYFENPTGGVATPIIHDELKVRGSDVDFISGTPFLIFWGQARVENHERVSLSIVKSPGGTGTTNIVMSQTHSQTVFDFNGVDDLSFLWTLPEGIDTSSPIEVTLDWSANAADSFDLELTALKLVDGTAIGSSVVSSLNASTTATADAANTMYLDLDLTPTPLSIQEMMPDDFISFELARTDTSNAMYPFSITIHYISFAVGEHVKK